MHNYTIAAVPNVDQSPCRDVDWTSAGGKWKHTCAHIGVTQGSAPHPLDSLTIEDVQCSVILNESSMGVNTTSAGCSHQNETTGFLAYRGGTEYGPVELNNFDVNVQVNTDQADSTCANPIAAIMATGGSRTSEIVWQDSEAHVTSSDSDEDITAIVTDSSNPVDLSVSNVSVEVNATAPGFTGTRSTLVSAPKTTLESLSLQTTP